MGVRGSQWQRGGAGAGPLVGGAVSGALLAFCSGRNGRAAESDGERGRGTGAGRGGTVSGAEVPGTGSGGGRGWRAGHGERR